MPVAMVMAVAAGAGLYHWFSPAAPPGMVEQASSTSPPTLSPLASPPLAPPLAAPLAAPLAQAGAATIALVQSAPPAIAVSPPEPVISPPKPREFQIETGDEARILENTATGRTVFRLSGNPGILVLDFTSLRDQGLMLNRVAAFVEKSGAPRDRILTDAELDVIVRRGGETVETFYYGHDYGAASLARFFSLADRDNIRLLESEETLRRLLQQEGWFDPEARGGLLSIPQITGDERIGKANRAVILRHELSHGEYFANPGYAAFVRHFWRNMLTGAERDRIRRYLRSQGYDATIDELMENEAQAYLMFTYSPDFFAPGMIGMSRARLNEIRAAFFRTMPGGWLRDGLGQYLAENKPSSPIKPAAARP